MTYETPQAENEGIGFHRTNAFEVDSSAIKTGEYDPLAFEVRATFSDNERSEHVDATIGKWR